MPQKQFKHDEIERSGSLSETIIDYVEKNTESPREAVMTLIRAASTASIKYGIKPNDVLDALNETMQN